MEHAKYKAHREAQGASDRSDQMIAVFRDRYGTIDGVEFDLRHKDLDLQNWLPPVFGDFPKKPSNAPFIWFPWYGDFNEKSLFDTAQKAVARTGVLTPIEKFRLSRNRGPTADQRQHFTQTDEEKIQAYIAENTPECIVFRGDRIEIDHVEIKLVRNAVDHLHDRETREAYLRVRRANSGVVEEIGTPISYTGVTSVLGYDIDSYNFENIAKRISDHFNLASVREMPSVERDGSDSYLALRKAFAMITANKGLDFSSLTEPTMVVKIREPNEEFHDGSNIRHTINDALMMGYLWAKHEFDPHVREHAEDKLRRELEKKTAARDRGKASGKVGTKNKEAKQAVVDKIAGDLWNADPTSSKTQIIRMISGKMISGKMILGGKKL